MQRLTPHPAASVLAGRRINVVTAGFSGATFLWSGGDAKQHAKSSARCWRGFRKESASSYSHGQLWEARAFFSSESSKAVSPSKHVASVAPAAATNSAAPAAGAASPTSTPSKPTSLAGKGDQSTSRGRKAGAGVRRSRADELHPRKRVGRRHSATAGEVGGKPANAKPMRSRRASDPARRRAATVRQKSAELLKVLNKNVAPLIADDATVPEAKRRLVNSSKPASAEHTPAPVPATGLSRRSLGRSRASAVDAATLSTPRLLDCLHLTSFVERVTKRVKSWSASFSKWAKPAADPTLREWERLLSLSLRRDSFTDCTDIQDAMQQRYEDRFGHSDCDVAFLSLYARVLVNNAMFCLMNFEVFRSTQLLGEAIRVSKEAFQARQKQGAATEVTGSPVATSSSRASSAANEVTLSGDVYGIGDPECYLLLLRVLLANAYASDQQYWKASEQYQIALSTMERNPTWCQDQIAPGFTSPLPLNSTFVTEDARLFYENTVRVDHAVSQGRAQLLLLQSQGSPTNAVRLLHAQLAMARLHRHAGRLAESQEFFESYLDGVAEHMEGEDVGGAMLELGRLLLYEEKNEDAAVIYLEAASKMLLDDAKTFLKAPPSAASDATLKGNAVVERHAAARNAAQRAAGALIDAAMALHAKGKNGQAIGLLEGCLQLLERAGLNLISGWVRRQYADMLTTVALVDRALDEYTRTIEQLRDGCGETVGQLGARGQLVCLSSAEVESHLAFCLQAYVGDHRRAMTHYRNVIQSTYKRNVRVKSAQMKLSKRARRQRTAAEGVVDADDMITSTGARRRTGPSRTNPPPLSAGLSRLGFSLQPDVLHWVLSNYVTCCERVGAFSEAMGMQNRLIEIEAALGGNVVESYMKLIELARQAGDMEKTLALCFYIFFLPDHMMPAEARLDVAKNFASSCHQLGNSRMGAVLLHAVQQVRGDHDANSLAQYAVCLKALDPADRVQLEGTMDIQASIDSIGRVFRRAASIVVTDMVLESVETAGAADEESPRSPAAASWSQERLEMGLNGLIVLSRGAFFFHQNRFTKDAEDLYAAALQHIDHLTASMPVIPDDYQREMGIVLVNYATLKSATDPQLATALYDRAATVCPTYLEVAEVVADVFVQAGDYVKGSAYMRRVMEANPSVASEMHLRLARLGTGPAWDTMTHGERMGVMEHLLRGLGITARRVTAAFAAASQTQTAETDLVSLAKIAPLLLDGVATVMSEDAVCLTTYVVQTRFQEPQLLNRLYRCAITRFPQHATILVNYATLCMYSGFHSLARMYIAKAYAASSGDLNCTMCYAHYLCRSYEDQQVGSGESLYGRFLGLHPNSAQGHAAFANYMAGVMPTPFKIEEHFKRALELAPGSEEVVLQYGQFMWACTDSKCVYTNDDVRQRIFDRTEELFKEAVALNPSSFTACHQLGVFYANRHNRFEDAITLLQRAHQMQPGNLEVVRHILSVMHGECVRIQKEEHHRSSAVAGQGGRVTLRTGQLRSLVDSTKDMFEHVIRMDPRDKATLDRYARFAVETLQDPALAASLYRRLQELNRE